jgi:methenyltetrahydrofolate cyclohydrolase
MTHPERPAAASSPGSLEAFLADLGSAAPAPGGGAAAALSGALAAALVAMVCRVTAERDPAGREALTGVITTADALRHRLAGLVTEDMDAYRQVVEARRSGAGAATVERALARATEVPVQLCRGSREVLGLCESVAPRARPSTLADLAVAAGLAWGALESGAVVARANLGAMADTPLSRGSEAELARLSGHGEEARQRVSETIAGRMKRRD